MVQPKNLEPKASAVGHRSSTYRGPRTTAPRTTQRPPRLPDMPFTAYARCALPKSRGKAVLGRHKAPCAMTLFLQGRCREEAQPTEQVRNHRYGPAPRKAYPQSMLFSFSSSPCVPHSRFTVLEGPCPCPSFRSSPPSPTLPGCANCSLLPGRTIVRALACLSVLPVTACFILDRYFPRNKVFLAAYPWPVRLGRRYYQYLLVSPQPALLSTVSYLF